MLEKKNIFVILAVLVIGGFVYLRFYSKKPSTISQQTIDVLAEQDRRTIDDLKKKLVELEDERAKLLESHKREIDEINEKYKKTLEDLQIKKSTTAKEIRKKYENDMPGLAKELSSVTGIQVVNYD